MFALRPHEAVEWSSNDVVVRFTGSSGTIVKLSNTHIALTNQNIRISVPTAHTYTVVGRGDTNFHEVCIPITSAKPHRIIQPWFGPYKWETEIQLASIPGLEPLDDHWTLLLTFAYGGAFEYRKAFLKMFCDATQAASAGIEELLPAYSET